MKREIFSIALLLMINPGTKAQVGTYTRAKNQIQDLILSGVIRVDEKVGTTVFNYLHPVEKVEVILDTIYITAKATHYKVTLKGEPKIIRPADAAPFHTYKTSIFFRYEEYYPRSVVLGKLYFNESTMQEGEHLKKFADNIVILREYYPEELEKKKNAEKLDSLLAEFARQAEQRRPASNKPFVTEEQRACMVQANVFFDQKLYAKVIEQYQKAIDLNPFSYPPLYYNLALVYALTENFQYAIFNMKRYLILDRDAEDARSAADKIIEWNINIDG